MKEVLSDRIRVGMCALLAGYRSEHEKVRRM